MDGRCGSLSLVIPAYNEEAVIRDALAEADQALAQLAADYEILIVDDGSRDATARILAEAAQARPHVRVLRHPENRGYGAALRTGFEAARFARVAFTDADCQFHLEDLALLVPLTDRVPVAVGRRLNRQDPWKRRFFSWGYNLLVRTLLGTGVRDCDCALKVFRKDALHDLLPESRGYFVNTEMLSRARQKGYAVEEIGVRHRPRRGGASKVSLLDIPRTLARLLPYWWSRVLFPGNRCASIPKATTAGWVISPFFLLVLAAALLFFSRLGCPLQEPEEPRYAEIPRQMLEAGNFVVPVLHGQPYYDKPPLLYWLVMGCYAVFGPEDWVAHLVPAAAAFLTVLVCYCWGKQTLGVRAAFLGALMLCLSARFVYLGRLLTMNSLLCLWVVAALASAHRAVRSPTLGWGWWLLSAAAAGLGLLTKGPVALALVVVPVAAHQALDARSARPRLAAWSAYLALAGLLATPWYVAAALQEPEFAGTFFWKHNVLRFLAPFDHEEPVWFYVPGLLVGMLPWSVLLWPLVKSFGRRWGTERPADLGFLLLSSLWCLAFYSAAGCKRAGYILPAMPPLALALGWYLDAMLAGQPTLSWARFARGLTFLVLLAGLSGVVAARWTGIVKTQEALGVAAACVMGLSVLLGPGRGWTVHHSWAVCGTTTFVLLFVAIQLALPGYARRFSMRGTLRPQESLAAQSQLPVICYPRRWDSVSFYLRRSDVTFCEPARRPDLIRRLRTEPQTLLVVKSDHSLTELLRDLPASLSFRPLGRHGRVTVGLVLPSQEVPAFLLAQRDVAED